MEEPVRPRTIRFGAFAVDLRSGEVRRHGVKLKLSGQPFEILALLLQHRGDVVGREELRAKLWPADTFVDFDHGLHAAINKLREALGDSAEKPRLIETLPRRGYRFIGTVEEIAAPSPAARAPAPSWVGQVARLCSDSNLGFILAPVDEQTVEEREKLEAANDDVGLSLLIASQRLLMVPTGTEVRVLEGREPRFRCQVRILEGEHYGKTALVLRKYLVGLS